MTTTTNNHSIILDEILRNQDINDSVQKLIGPVFLSRTRRRHHEEFSDSLKRIAILLVVGNIKRLSPSAENLCQQIKDLLEEKCKTLHDYLALLKSTIDFRFDSTMTEEILAKITTDRNPVSIKRVTTSKRNGGYRTEYSLDESNISEQIKLTEKFLTQTFVSPEFFKLTAAIGLAFAALALASLVLAGEVHAAFAIPLVVCIIAALVCAWRVISWGKELAFKDSIQTEAKLDGQPYCLSDGIFETQKKFMFFNENTNKIEPRNPSVRNPSVDAAENKLGTANGEKRESDQFSHTAEQSGEPGAAF